MPGRCLFCVGRSRKDADLADRIKTGEKYTKEIINAIKRCDVFLLVLSPNAEQSEWVPKELGNAIQYYKYIILVKIRTRPPVWRVKPWYPPQTRQK